MAVTATRDLDGLEHRPAEGREGRRIGREETGSEHGKVSRASGQPFGIEQPDVA